MSTQPLVFMKQLLDNVEYADEQGVLNVIKLFNHQNREVTDGTSYALGAFNVIHELIERRPELFTPKIIQELALLAEGNDERVRSAAKVSLEMLKERGKVAATELEPARGSVQCAECEKSFDWEAAYHQRNTPRSEPYNPPGHGAFRPRAFCPHCGSLVAEWDIDAHQDRNSWRWHGDNSGLNAGRSFPQSPVVLWGHPLELISRDLIVPFEKDHIDVSVAKRLEKGGESQKETTKGENKDQSDIGRLTAIALDLDKSAEARETAWDALEKMGELVTAFAQGLKHANPEIRRTMVMNLGYTNDQRAVEPLIQALQDDDGSMRRGAAESLGKLGDPRVVQPLIAALHDKDESVREAAAEALERVEGQKRSGGKSS